MTRAGRSSAPPRGTATPPRPRPAPPGPPGPTASPGTGRRETATTRPTDRSAEQTRPAPRSSGAASSDPGRVRPARRAGHLRAVTSLLHLPDEPPHRNRTAAMTVAFSVAKFTVAKTFHRVEIPLNPAAHEHTSSPGSRAPPPSTPMTPRQPLQPKTSTPALQRNQASPPGHHEPPAPGQGNGPAAGFGGHHRTPPHGNLHTMESPGNTKHPQARCFAGLNTWPGFREYPGRVP